MYLSRIIILFFLITVQVCYGQDWKAKFDDRLASNLGFSYDKLKRVSKRTDAYNYIALGYFLNANNLMYLKTKQEKYLVYNKDILDEMLSNVDESNTLNWKWKVVQKDDTISYVDNVVLEGYFYRYLGEYIDVLVSNNIDEININKYLEILENGFKKWVNRSKDIYGDPYSYFFHIRIHIASNWGTAALYLDKFKQDTLYSDYLKLLNNQLKSLLTLKDVNGLKCYTWQSNYQSQFTISLQRKTIENPVIQDVGHANHVVSYLVASYELGYDTWTKEDLVYLSNTLKELIWKKNEFKFSDNVDGSASKDLEFKDQGWKQSDGWIKLIKYNKGLEEIYKTYYSMNKDIVFSSSMALQYYVNLL